MNIWLAATSNQRQYGMARTTPKTDDLYQWDRSPLNDCPTTVNQSRVTTGGKNATCKSLTWSTSYSDVVIRSECPFVFNDWILNNYVATMALSYPIIIVASNDVVHPGSDFSPYTHLRKYRTLELQSDSPWNYNIGDYTQNNDVERNNSPFNHALLTLKAAIPSRRFDGKLSYSSSYNVQRNSDTNYPTFNRFQSATPFYIFNQLSIFGSANAFCQIMQITMGFGYSHDSQSWPHFRRWSAMKPLNPT